MSLPNLDLAVLGVGLWAEGLGTWGEARARWRGEADGTSSSASPKPQTTLLPAAERRRAPATVLLALAVAEQACREAGLDAREMRSVFTSAHGDLELTDYLCATLAEAPEHLSPTKFHHSVHNAASGYWTIGAGNRQASTAISAGQNSFAQGLLEAATQVVCEQMPVLLVAYDMPAPRTLVPITQSTALVGLALVLAPIQSQPTDWPGHSLTLRLQDIAPHGLASITTPPPCPPDIAALMPRSPMAVGLSLVHALATREHQGPVELSFRSSLTQALIVSLAGGNHDGRR